MPLERHIHVIIDLEKYYINPLIHDDTIINSFLDDHNIDKLCLYIESNLLKYLIKLGNLSDDRELVTKIIFQMLLSNIPNYSINTEVEIKKNILYADLLMIENESDNNKRRNRFIFEFKNKNVNFLELKIKGMF